MRLKIEINTREHFSALGLERKRFFVSNPWYSGKGDISSFKLEELLATKLRALYQRKKGRDLYDLWLALNTHEINEKAVCDCLKEYLAHSSSRISRAEFESNLTEKIVSKAFRVDVEPLLRAGADYNVDAAASLVQERFLVLL